MLDIDGTDGGGQILRTALSLSVVTDTPFRIAEVRRSRPTPGLQPQHLAAVELAGACCGADLDGVEVGADQLEFVPGDDRETTLNATIDTAGSLTLLFETMLPIGAVAPVPLTVHATGGTDVKWAPTMAYYRRVKLPLLARFGLDATVDVRRHGYYPVGGGAATLETVPASLSPLQLDERGPLEAVEVYSRATDSLADQEVADRQASHAAERLRAAEYPVGVESVEYVPADSPGSSLLVRGVYGRTLLGADALGERGRPSERVADLAVEGFERAHAASAPVDSHMADQLLVFLALVGGSVRLPTVTDHVRTNLRVLQAFGSDIELVETADGDPRVTATAHGGVAGAWPD